MNYEKYKGFPQCNTSIVPLCRAIQRTHTLTSLLPLLMRAIPLLWLGTLSALFCCIMLLVRTVVNSIQAIFIHSALIHALFSNDETISNLWCPCKRMSCESIDVKINNRIFISKQSSEYSKKKKYFHSHMSQWIMRKYGHENRWLLFVKHVSLHSVNKKTNIESFLG